MAGIPKMAAVWQNTEFDVCTFDYQWTIQDALSRLQATQLETPSFKTALRVQNNLTGEMCTPSWKLVLKHSSPDYKCKTCGTVNSGHGYYSKYYVVPGIAVTDGMDGFKTKEQTPIWVNARVCILMPNEESDSKLASERNVAYIPYGGEQGAPIQLQYKCLEFNDEFLNVAYLNSYIVDGSLTLYIQVTARVFQDSVCNFVNEIPAPRESLKQADYNLSKSMDKARRNGLFTDITLVCDGKEFKAHKVVLATQSSFFKTRFEKRWEREDKVEMSDLTPDVVEAMLSFMYNGEVSNTDVDQLALQLLPAAEEYGMIDLRQQCEKALAQSLTNDNVIDKLILAEAKHATELKQACMTHIMKNPSEVRKTASWEVLKGSTEHSGLYLEVLEHMTDLLSCDTLYN